MSRTFFEPVDPREFPTCSIAGSIRRLHMYYRHCNSCGIVINAAGPTSSVNPIVGYDRNIITKYRGTRDCFRHGPNFIPPSSQIVGLTGSWPLFWSSPKRLCGKLEIDPLFAPATLTLCYAVVLPARELYFPFGLAVLISCHSGLPPCP